jgi:hypothetical protein
MGARVRHFNTGELGGMEAVQESAMQDICRILTYGEVKDNRGVPRWDYTVGRVIPCGLRISASVAFNLIVNADQLGESEVPMGDFSLRLPMDTEVTPNDRIRITHRFDENTTDIDYEVVGPIHRGVSCLILKVRPSDKARIAA